MAPSESTNRRTLQRLDGDALDAAIGAWAAESTQPPPGTRRALAVDGKTLRGSGSETAEARHLLAAIDHRAGVVLGQIDVAAKTNIGVRIAPTATPTTRLARALFFFSIKWPLIMHIVSD